MNTRTIGRAAMFAAAIYSFFTPAFADIACRDQKPHEPGRTTYSIESGGRQRHYDTYVPDDLSGSGPVALVLDLQASGLSPEAEMAVTGMAAAADRYRFIVAAPAAITPFPRGGYTWNIPAKPGGPDDVAFIRDMIARLKNEFCIDEQRIFAAGYSGGARFASELACRMPGTFSAIAAVGGLRYPQGDEGICPVNGPPVPIIAFHSVDDTINLYNVDGRKGAPPYWTYGIETALERWARRNGCREYTSRPVLSGKIQRRTYTRCREGGQIIFYRLSGSGHVWPGSRFEFPDYVGALEPGLPATELILEFFGLDVPNAD